MNDFIFKRLRDKNNISKEFGRRIENTRMPCGIGKDRDCEE